MTDSFILGESGWTNPTPVPATGEVSRIYIYLHQTDPGDRYDTTVRHPTPGPSDAHPHPGTVLTPTCHRTLSCKGKNKGDIDVSVQDGDEVSVPHRGHIPIGTGTTYGSSPPSIPHDSSLRQKESKEDGRRDHSVKV